MNSFSRHLTVCDIEPGLTPLDFSLMETFFKGRCVLSVFANADDLRGRVTDAAAEVMPDKLHHTWEDILGWTL
jgi:hypothetical protein